MERRRILRAAAATVISLCTPSLIRAGGLASIEINFFFDESSSMYTTSSMNYIVQRDGHVRAILSPEISDLLLEKQAYVRVIMWAESERNLRIIYSGRMTSLGKVRELALTISRDVPTSIAPFTTIHSSALIGARSLERRGDVRVVDISTDEKPDDTILEDCREARDSLTLKGFTVNVLAIDPFGSISPVLKKYVQTVDGFTHVVYSWEKYAEAIRWKILRELHMV